MTESFARARRVSLACAAIAVALISGNAALGAETIVVRLDQAKIARLPSGVSTIVVGNPLIADVAVQSGGLVVVTGKGFGSTNVIALDRKGNVLMERSITVRGPNGSVVSVYRGIERETYSCTPNCERRITLGDSTNYFTATLGQTGQRDGQASAAGAKR